MSFVTFIIPSIGRATLPKTLESLHAQTDAAWEAIIVYDNIEPTVPSTKRIRTFRTPHRLGIPPNGAGAVRNHGIQHVTTPWVAFVDDDDVLDTTYVAALRHNVSRHPRLPAMIFRMVTQDGRVLPPAEHNMFQPCAVGISFCVRMDFWRAHQLTFHPSSMEDYTLLLRIHSLSDMLLASQITYFVRNHAHTWKRSSYPEHVIPAKLPLPPGSWSMSCAPGARVLPGGRLVARLRRMNGSYANVDQVVVPGRGYGNADGRLVEE